MRKGVLTSGLKTRQNLLVGEEQGPPLTPGTENTGKENLSYQCHTDRQLQPVLWELTAPPPRRAWLTAQLLPG
jgi:hypothetical protein